MIIRRAFEYDVHKLARLWLAMVNELNPDFDPNLQWWRRDTLNMMRHDKDYMCLLAEEGGKVVGFSDGYIMLEPAQGKILFFSRHSYVQPELRHGDVIKKIYRELTAEARARGAQALMFGCGDTTKAMWESHGYRQVEYTMVGDLHEI